MAHENEQLAIARGNVTTLLLPVNSPNPDLFLKVLLPADTEVNV